MTTKSESLSVVIGSLATYVFFLRKRTITQLPCYLMVIQHWRTLKSSRMFGKNMLSACFAKRHVTEVSYNACRLQYKLHVPAKQLT
jgi:hypothetical protein